MPCGCMWLAGANAVVDYCCLWSVLLAWGQTKP